MVSDNVGSRSVIAGESCFCDSSLAPATNYKEKRNERGALLYRSQTRVFIVANRRVHRLEKTERWKHSAADRPTDRLYSTGEMR